MPTPEASPEPAARVVRQLGQSGRGRVIGISTLEGSGSGIGVAIPSNTISVVVPLIIRRGRVVDPPR